MICPACQRNADNGVRHAMCDDAEHPDRAYRSCDCQHLPIEVAIVHVPAQEQP